ncbi:MAG: hypothetical protein HYX50_00685 [Chloroflexi bacterium]|nr:hypothetical protein [Chloroflexota bacterium]
MARRANRFIRRERADAAFHANGDHVPPAHRRPGGRRGMNFAAQFTAAQAVIGFDDNDSARLGASRAVLAAHVYALAVRLDAELASHEETAALFAETEEPGGRRAALVRWLTCMVHAPLDAGTVEYLVLLGHEHVRPRDPVNRIKAKYVVAMVSRVQSLLIGVLCDAIPDATECGGCVVAWCKVLTLHLDTLLSVHSATEGSTHWY